MTAEFAVVPNWTNMEGSNEAHTYVNGSLDAGMDLAKYGDLDRPITRAETAGIIEALTDLGIFKGSSATGNFDPYNNLARSAFATLNQRIDETFGLSDGENKTKDPRKKTGYKATRQYLVLLQSSFEQN